MRRVAFFLVCLGLGCAAEPAAPSLDTELRAAWDAYAAYCGLCPAAPACCLREADFSRQRFGPAATPYLRALQDRYQCMRGDTLIDASLYSAPPLDPLNSRDRAHLPPRNRVTWSCEMHACMAAAETMAAELDHALATPTPHPPGASLICFGRSGAP